MPGLPARETSQSDFPIGSSDDIEFLVERAPAPGVRTPIAYGIDWVYQPLPFRLDHVNCWLLDADAAGPVQVDTGVATDITRSHWQRALGDQRPEALVVTHFHPDHAGLAGDHVRAGVPVYASQVEMEISARIWRLSDDEYAGLYAGWYRRHGLGAEAIDGALAMGNGYRHIVSEPVSLDNYRCLQPGDRVQLAGRDWDVMHGRGHAPAMIMLYDADERVLIAADQVLPSISPNVSLSPSTPEQPSPFQVTVDDPLGQFLDTLDSLKALPDDTLVLPSHGLPFKGLHARLDVLQAHHAQRLEQVMEACQEPRTAADLFDVLFGKKLDAQQMSFALGESLAHAEHLVLRGDMERDDSGEIVHYRARLR